MKRYNHFYKGCLLLLFITIFGGCASTPFSGCSLEDKKSADINVQLGVEYMRRGRNDIALSRLKKALNHCHYSGDAHNAIAVLYGRLGMAEEAEPHYQQAIALMPEAADIHNNYGQFLCQKSQWDEAHKHFLKAIENPVYRTPEIPYTNAALCALQHKDYATAETYLHKALQKNSKFPRALYKMAHLRYEQKRDKKAREYLQRCLKVAKHTPETLWLGIRIERRLNNRDAEATYALLLRKNFPDSEATRLLNQSE
ncbi:MAG: type IV pilus biogenesis/stability protein PilW [Candidatus Parabeggiatoa sp.]|nr:type IV pilus biogenesis/stability protein PilW [Candidatus Parabeggiatoa sp.]